MQGAAFGQLGAIQNAGSMQPVPSVSTQKRQTSDITRRKDL